MAGVSIELRPEGGYLLRAECFVSLLVEDVFAFFSDPANLEKLTPPRLNFRILTPTPIEMHAGLLLDYKLRIRGVPARWQSEITLWDPPHRFADEARRGPYKHWRHEHRFESCDGGTRVFDDVHYAVPGEALIHGLLVGGDIRKIFRFRQLRLAELFPAGVPSCADANR